MRTWIFALLLALSTTALAVGALADEAVFDDQGRLTSEVRDDGVTVHDVYDEDGSLIEEHTSDGEVIHHPVDEETP